MEFYKALSSIEEFCDSTDEILEVSRRMFGNIESMLYPKANEPFFLGSHYFEKLYTQHNDKFIDSVLENANELPFSNGTRYYKAFPQKIGIVCDEGIYNCYESVADLIYITQENYEKHANALDVFVVYTTWRGLNKDWLKLSDPLGPAAAKLSEIICCYKEKGIKIVFLSGEDPPHYHHFLHIAKQCDYILTSAAEVVDEYKKDCGHKNVFQHPFAINPLLHNPVGSMSDFSRKEALFAGTWWATKYPERGQDMHLILDGLIEADVPLNILDRNFYFGNRNVCYPEEYIPYLSPPIDQKLLQKVHKLFYLNLNFNSVKDSATMFARRVTELQAMGSILLSNHGLGIHNLFPNVKIYADKESIGLDFKATNDKDVLELRAAGIRNVMAEYVSFDILAGVFKKIGLEILEKNKKDILVVADVLSNGVIEMYEAQSYEHKGIMSFEEFLEVGASSYAAVTFWNNAYRYEQYYLEDMLNGFKYTDCDYITKDAYYRAGSLVDGISHDYVSCMPDKYRSMFWAESFSCEQLCGLNGAAELENGYSIDPVGIDVLPDTMNKECNAACEITFIIPTHNNGRHLEYKAFSSLKRSDIFNKAKVLLVDDGSTDLETLEIIKRLVRTHDNVEAYFFPTGGSGSIARPRSQGIAMTTTPYVAFLDPENEALGNGYSSLLRAIQEHKCDFALGELIHQGKEQEATSMVSTYQKILQKDEGVLNLPEDFLAKTQAQAHDVQALVICAEHLQKNHLEAAGSVLGQNVSFFHQLLGCSKTIVCLDSQVCVSYERAATSTDG
ncbi:MAG: glycosyltransferase [Coriobacteriia bacterium]|nr:glycosyltransferase [Coriobacteriia bacterium]